MARKILLADDSVTAQNMGRKILTDAGYDVITVNNGSAALKRVGEQKPDLIVLDVYMPGYSGLEVCARLKDAPDTARIPILLTVGKLEPFKPEEASRVRADAYIVKPFEASELLSALTRLEDRMVPQAESARFTTSVSGIERFTAESASRKSEPAEEDSGWKSRLRFPSKKKKEEPEPDPAPEEDFTVVNSRKGPFKAPAASGTFPVSSAPQAQEPGLVPDIPRDITPEELDALSELVAKLDGPIPAAEAVAPLSEKIGPAESAPVPAPSTEEAKKEEIKQEVAPSAVADVAAAAEAAPAIEAVAAVEEKVESVPAVAEVSATPTFTVEPPAVETTADASSQVEVVAPESPAVSKIEAVSVVEASAPAVSDEEKSDAAVADAVAATSETPPESAVPAEVAVAAPVEEPKAEEPPHVEPTPEPVVAAASATENAVSSSPQVPAPSAEDLAEALRLLTPQTGQTLAEAGAALVAELSRGSGGNRWVAEAVALSPEEASASLEAEMFRSFSARSVDAAASNEAAVSSSPVGHEEEEAAEAAVEAAEAVAENREAYTPVPVESEPAPVTVSATPVEAAESAAQEVETPVETKAAEDAPQEEVAAMTFADAVRSEPEVAAMSSAEEVSLGDESGGSEEMAKDAKGKGKSNWHQIHSATEATAKADVVEAAKQSEEAPKAMAAAAADGGSDASAIASIVDSVLADLRPKIVEEIAKKLAKK